jgi:hypothetical protein
MGFDAAKFVSAAFRPRTADVAVPDLRHFFFDLAEGEVPTWKVRGLTGEELARVNESTARNRSRNAIAEALLSKDADKLKEGIQELIGPASTVPDDLAKRLEMLVIGSVEPAVDQQLAVKLSQAFPVEFFQLTNKVTELTGMGAEVGKPQRSSKAQKSSSC